MARKASAVSKALTALRLASREEGVTADQLSEATGLKRRRSQVLLQDLFELLNEERLIDAALLRNKEPNTDSEGRQLPGAPVWVYRFRVLD
jgi:hypothetical protein